MSKPNETLIQKVQKLRGIINTQGNQSMAATAALRRVLQNATQKGINITSLQPAAPVAVRAAPAVSAAEIMKAAEKRAILHRPNIQEIQPLNFPIVGKIPERRFPTVRTSEPNHSIQSLLKNPNSTYLQRQKERMHQSNAKSVNKEVSIMQEKVRKQQANQNASERQQAIESLEEQIAILQDDIDKERGDEIALPPPSNNKASAATSYFNKQKSASQAKQVKAARAAQVAKVVAPLQERLYKLISLRNQLTQPLVAAATAQSSALSAAAADREDVDESDDDLPPPPPPPAATAQSSALSAAPAALSAALSTAAPAPAAAVASTTQKTIVVTKTVYKNGTVDYTAEIAAAGGGRKRTHKQGNHKKGNRKQSKRSHRR